MKGTIHILIDFFYKNQTFSGFILQIISGIIATIIGGLILMYITNN